METKTFQQILEEHATWLFIEYPKTRAEIRRKLDHLERTLDQIEEGQKNYNEKGRDALN